MARWELAGLVCQIVGALLALVGLNQSKRQLFPGSGGVAFVGPLVVRTRDVWRRIFKPKPTTATAHAGVARGEGRATGRAFSEVTSGSDDLLTQRVSLVEQRLERLRIETEEARANLATEDAALGRRIDQVAVGLDETRQELRAFARDAVAGEGGRGLDLAFYGVLMALVGTVLSALG